MKKILLALSIIILSFTLASANNNNYKVNSFKLKIENNEKSSIFSLEHIDSSMMCTFIDNSINNFGSTAPAAEITVSISVEVNVGVGKATVTVQVKGSPGEVKAALKKALKEAVDAVKGVM